MKYSTRRKINAIVYHFFVILFGFIMIYPLLWMLLSSFKPTEIVMTTTAELLPRQWTLDNYRTGWKGFGGIGFGTFFKNSFFISTLATIGAVFSSALVAFGFSRFRFPYKKFWFTCVMITMMLPYQIIMIPQFILFEKMNWVGTYLPLIVPYFFGQSFFIFLVMQFVQGIPKDLDEAARIDGCSNYGIFFRIILPLIVPALVTSALFSFMWRWDDFLSALLYLNKPSRYPISIALKLFADPSAQSDWGAMFAMATLSLLPVFLIFIFFQKYLVEGISTQGIKG